MCIYEFIQLTGPIQRWISSRTLSRHMVFSVPPRASQYGAACSWRALPFRRRDPKLTVAKSQNGLILGTANDKKTW